MQITRIRSTPPRRNRLRFVTLTLVVLAAIGPTGCASTTKPNTARVMADSSEALFDSMAARGGAGASIWLPEELADVLPNQEYEIDGRAAEPMSPGTVIGTPESVELVKTYMQDDFAADGPTSRAVDHNDPRAAWRAYKVTVKVDKLLGIDQRGRTFEFGLTFGAEIAPKSVEEGVMAFGEVVAVLTKPGFFDFDRDLHALMLTGATLGTVDSQGNISFPAMNEIAPRFVGDLKTVDAVVNEAAKSKLTKSVKFHN